MISSILRRKFFCLKCLSTSKLRKKHQHVWLLTFLPSNTIYIYCILYRFDKPDILANNIRGKRQYIVGSLAFFYSVIVAWINLWKKEGVLIKTEIISNNVNIKKAHKSWPNDCLIRRRAKQTHRRDFCCIKYREKEYLDDHTYILRGTVEQWLAIRIR